MSDVTTVDVVGSAPGRVNLIGEHTDYNGGFALPLAIPHRTTAAVRRRDDRIVTATSSRRDSGPVEFHVDSEPGDVTGWSAYVAGVFWALRHAGYDVPGADVHIDSDVPSGAGLSSSAALECSVLVALNALAGLELDPTRSALLAQQAENEYVRAPTGLMDQMAAMHGRDGHVILFDAADVNAEPIPCDLAGAGLTLLIIDTRAPHRHADGEYGARRRSCEHAARRLGVSSLRDVQDEPVESVVGRLEPGASGEPHPEGTPLSPDTPDVTRRRVRHVLTENGRVQETVQLLRAGRIRDVGPLLTASHVSLRDDYEVTVPQLDVAVDAALHAGAHGARMTGGGFGGSIIALVDTERAEAVTAAVRQAFTRYGFATPDAFVAVPSAGAGVVSPSR
ncbi:galactokinase [Actinobacteria bacterium YIM 96077]|uniref:Galactokinase n=1 Tax=Phytoactinopolyspora halophila TaxID=1981511 RepID=A0A329QGF1_9ACTN|nr:galactokinase [Phytoactinopolyspora halophila]AYY14464.1 galactokinase [Actinobacteria bacterium YIM 96077]RAW11457.1 galactokinase [Phytoactinopolyspora halophila]